MADYRFNPYQMHRYSSAGAGGAGLGPPMTVQPSAPNRKLSVSEMMGVNQRGGPNMSTVTDAASGRRLSNLEAQARGPFTTMGSGVGRGRGGYGGLPRFGNRISSAGVAGGTPTSRRGRADLAMQNDPFLAPEEAWLGAEKPAWQQSAEDRSATAFDSNPRYGSMGRPIVRGANVGTDTLPAYADGTKDSGPKPKLAIVGERGPEAMIVPAHSQIIPDLGPKAAQAFAIDEVEPAGIKDGEIRQDAQGNYWKYDAAQKRGIPMNPYINNPNAPSPDAFRATAAERYLDLSNRLSALRQEGMAEGRAAVARFQEQQAQEAAKTAALLASGQPVSEGEGGGTLYQLPRGHAIVGGTRPKSFTVENWEGGQTTSPNLAEVDRESRADAAERTVRGLPMRSYRAQPTTAPSAIATAAPTALEEVVDVDVEETPVQVVQEERKLGKAPARREAGKGLEDMPRAVNPRPIVTGFMGAPVAAMDSALLGNFAKNIEQPEKLSRIDEAAEGIENKVMDFVKAGWNDRRILDWLFHPEGTEREQQKALLDRQLKELEQKGWKVVRDSEGNAKSITRPKKLEEKKDA